MTKSINQPKDDGTRASPDKAKDRRRRLQWGTLIEWSAIALWAIWVGRAYLNPDPLIWPTGAEYGLSMQSHFVWQAFAQCGSCFMWNGGINGGTPAFVELQGAALHPLVVVSSLLFGAIDGSKVILIGSLAMAGFAQWWLAKVLGLGRLARLWSAALIVVGGHLAGRMEHGVMNVVLSTAACNLMLPPLLKLFTTGGRRAALQLAITAGLAMLAGQGYLQIGVVLSYLPAVLVLVLRNPQRPKHVGKESLIAALLAVLIAGALLVPVLHFWPNFEKLTDPGLSGSQPLEYVPLSFVIRDMAFFQNPSLQKLPVPYFYMNYIGWVPVLLAIIGLRLVPTSSRRVLAFLGAAFGLVLLAASTVSLRLLEAVIPDFVAGIRYPILIAGLAAPLLVALAAWGLDLLVRQKWPKIGIELPQNNTNTSWQFELKWLVLAIPLVWSIDSAYAFTAPWLNTDPTGMQMQPVVDQMKPASAQWLAFPFTESFWLPAALNANLKVSATYLPWYWKGRAKPPAYLEATRDTIMSTSPGFVKEIDGLYLVKRPTNEYAYIDTGTQQIPCRATALGGNVDVDCDSSVAGTLVVKENSWIGWNVRLDGAPADLGAEPWLNAVAPAGLHHFEFRYQPWDVPLGFITSLVGVGLIIWLWIRAKPEILNGKAKFI